MEIIKIPLEQLTPDPHNAKDHPQWQIEQIKNSIEQFGNLDPIGVWGDDNLIVEGHGRYEALKDLGYHEAECIRLDWLTEEERTAYALAHNKLTMNSGFIPEALDMNLDAIGEIDMSLFGFDIPKEQDEPTEVVEDEVPEEADTRCKLGDIWQLGDHRLVCGDSTDITTVDTLMDGAKADMVFTDPPYNVAFNGRSGKFDVIENDDLHEDDFKDLITAFCNIVRMLSPQSYYIWCNWQFYGILQEQLKYKNCIVWAKNVFGLGNGYRHQHEFCLFNGTIDSGINNESDLWQIAKDTNYVHPTQKPIALCARALKNHKNARTVVDLFGGSGSTLIACEQLNRKCFICELDPHYCDVIIQRWENLTGRKAVLMNDAG